MSTLGRTGYARLRAVAAAGFGVYLLAAAYLVFWPHATTPNSVTNSITDWLAGLGGGRWAPQIYSGHYVEFVLNVVMLVPLTVFGSVFRPRWEVWRWALLGFVVSAGIELAQGLLLPHRNAEIADIVANTLGAFLGAALARGIARGYQAWPLRR